MQPSIPTRGQLERTLSQQVEALYASELGHRPGKVTCHIFGEQITVIVEEAITQPEQLLTNSGQEDLAEKVRMDLDKALQPKMAELIAEVTGIRVSDLLSDAKLETGRNGIIAILETAPKLREPASRASSRKQMAAGSSNLDGSSESV
ncbi:DUF2294 domain-containing protein [Oculatella sp. LEGE 06141]|uniref:DUF2294 domain-containing protein n=1 Tax=Oculatella sp. LEGE 06141 TaxID=1828648 RepID=UPI001881D3E0|nr:DUF2294 domain-containing protein [Oculatella sp. LEGE 06141]MBE9177057.1 DUF2294 domain-containing protein [Oculatella sp. LEGE 06141]